MKELRRGKDLENLRPPKAGNRGELLPALGGKEKGWKSVLEPVRAAAGRRASGAVAMGKRMQPLPEKWLEAERERGRNTLTSLLPPSVSIWFPHC